MRKGFSAIFVLGLILAVSVFIGVFFLKGRANRVGNVFTTSLASPQTSTIPLPLDEPIPTTPLNFVELVFKRYEDQVHIKLSSISSGLVKPVLCLNDGTTNTDFTNLKNRVPSDPIIAKAAETIESYKQIYYDYEGKKIVEYVGEGSNREILYYDICKLNGIYFFLFESYGDRGDGKVDMGQFGPKYFAYTDQEGNLTVIEDIENKATTITLPPVNDPNDHTTPTSTIYNTRYWGCRSMFTANNAEAFIGCGGGDGAFSSSSIFRLDLKTQDFVEKYFCYFNGSGQGRYKEVCYNQNGQIYHSVFN